MGINAGNIDPKTQEELLKDFPGEIQKGPGSNIVVTSVDGIINWARANSLWPTH